MSGSQEHSHLERERNWGSVGWGQDRESNLSGRIGDERLGLSGMLPLLDISKQADMSVIKI
jgi:hypothetical protein